MKISDMINMCLRNLWRRKGRTFLTVIGVVIGSCAVIVMISLGLGMNAAMDKMLASWGDLTAVTIYNYSYGGDQADKPALNEDAVLALGNIENVSYIIPKMQINSEMVTVVAGKNDRYKLSWADIYGIDFDLMDKMGYVPESGEFPNESEYDSSIIFGYEMPYQFMDTKKKGQNAYTWRQELPDGTFTKPFIDPLSDHVKICINNTKKTDSNGNYLYGGRDYEFKMKGAAVLQQDPNWETPYSLFIDIDLAKTIINDYNRLNSVKNPKNEYTQVKIVVDDIEHVDAVQTAVEEMGFTASSMAQVRNEMKGTLGTIQLVLGCLAAISLLVAAISITNTMIMSIYERTREIGIMKVLGCFISNIRLVFLMEAGMIGLLGGMAGTIISYILSAVMNVLGGEMFSSMLGIASDGESAISIIPPWLVLLALIFSTIIGLISGFYPANRAVKISALEAIRNE